MPTEVKDYAYMTKTTPKHKPDCIFCKIANHELESKIVLENDDFLAFYDIRPVSQGHTLVVTKKHIDDFGHLVQEDADYLKRYLNFIEDVRRKIKKQHQPKGIKVTFNTDGLIEVWHVHCHLVPVY